MNQLSNIIRVEEGGVSTPYIVYERINQFENPKLPEGFKLIREQRGNEAFLLVCEPIKDAVFEDIPTEEETKSHKHKPKESQVDVKV